MNREETKRILTVIAATYPNFRVPDKTVMIDTWSVILEPYEYKDVNAGLAAYIRTDRSGFAPAPGQIIGMINEAKEETITEADAWAMVYKAFTSTSVYDMQSAFESLPTAVRKAVGSASNLRSWGYEATTEALPVIESNFKKAYRATDHRKQVQDSIRHEFAEIGSRTAQRMIES